MDRISVKLFLVTEVCFPERPRILIYASCLAVNCFELTAASLRCQIWKGPARQKTTFF